MPGDRSRRYEFTAAEIDELLRELDRRLRARGVAASIFVVGGAAIAATGVRDGRLTADVDAMTRDQEVLEEAHAIAHERGLPSNWLNPQASMWMPPLPPHGLDKPAEPGLRVTYADDGFLLATKLVAQRTKDADDLRALAASVGLARATPAQLEAHIRTYYTDHEALKFIVSGSDVDRELHMLAQDAARMLHLANKPQATQPQTSARRRPNTPTALPPATPWIPPSQPGPDRGRGPEL